MIFNVRNVTDELITLSEYSINISPGQTIDLLEELQLFELQQCESMMKFVVDNALIVNNGEKDLTITEASKFLHNQALAPTDRSGRPRMHQTSRPEGTTTCWMAIGDDMTNPDPTKRLGQGNPCIINHRIGEQDSPFYLDFCTMQNITYIHEGHISYSDCNFDKIECMIVPQLVTPVPATGTSFRMYNGIIIPAANDGDVDLDLNTLMKPDGGLVQVKYDETGKKTSAGFWDADWNETSHCFENLTAAPDGSGEFNIFYYEMVFSRFVVDFLVGSGSALYQSSDIDRLWHGMRLKVQTYTCGLDWQYEEIEDHPWRLTCRFTLHRERLV